MLRCTSFHADESGSSLKATWRLAQAKSKSKAPYSQYDSLQQQGAKIHWGSPSDSSAIPSGDFDVVYDNNGKDMDACKPLIDAFKVVVFMLQLQSVLQYMQPCLLHL